MRRRSILPEDTWACLSLTAIVAALFLIAGIDQNGIWDPHELERAELARRIAIHVFGADLEVPGALNTMPTLSDLEAGELGFTSMAAGFATWGLHDFAGRLPLALWSFCGVLAVFVAMTRMVSARAGMFAGIVLSTMPLYFVQARTMLGDAVTLAASAMCFFGFAAALVDRDDKAALFLGLLGLAGAGCGFLSRGWLIGVAAPAGGVGLAWLALLGSGDERWRAPRRMVVGAMALTMACVAGYLGAAPLIESGHELREVKRAVGAAVMFGPAPESSFDMTLRELGHGLFPWSAFVPLSFGLVLVRRDRSGVRTLLLVGAACAYGVHASLAPFTGAIAFAGVAVLAAMVGMVMDELDAAPPSPLVGVGALLLVGVLLRDMLTLPDKGLAAFAVPAAEMPVAAAESLADYLYAAAAVFVTLVALAWASPSPDTLSTSVAVRVRARVTHYEEVVRDVTKIWAGNLAFGFLVLEAGLLGMGATLLIGRRLAWNSVIGIPRTWAYVGLNLWWALPLLLVTVPVAIDIVRRTFSWSLSKVRAPRSLGALLAALGAGGILCFGYYGAMAEQLSPKGALDAYAARHVAGEPLGLLGVNPRMGRYYARGDQTTQLATPRGAIRWLAEDADGPRRFLAFREAQLAELNSLHRHAHGANLPMVASGSGHILLAESGAGEEGANPLAPFVGSVAPADVQHPVDARFGDALRVVGWEVTDDDGRRVDAVTAGTPYRFRIFLEVEARVSRNFRAFIHIDAAGRRHNGDHAVLEGMYPMTYWREGDHIVDEHRFTLERHFGPGRYAVYFGFYIFKERMPVTVGRHHENRVVGGVLEVL